MRQSRRKSERGTRRGEKEKDNPIQDNYIIYIDTHPIVRSHRQARIPFSVTPATFPKVIGSLSVERNSYPALAGASLHSFSSISCAFFHQLYGLLPVQLSLGHPPNLSALDRVYLDHPSPWHQPKSSDQEASPIELLDQVASHMWRPVAQQVEGWQREVEEFLVT